MKLSGNQKESALNWLIIISGNILTGIGTGFFFVPEKIITGGAGDIGTILYHISGTPPGISIFSINLLFLIIGFKANGRAFALRSLIGAVLYSATVQVCIFLPVFRQDAFLSAMSGGIVVGLGSAMAFLGGGNTGGTDILSRVMQIRFPYCSIGKWNAIINTVIIIFSLFVFRSKELLLYGIMALFVKVFLIDYGMRKMSRACLFIIISEKTEEITRKMIEGSTRGITVLEGFGAYTKHKKGILLSVMKKKDLPYCQEKIKETDPEAFVIHTSADEIYGNGFKVYR